MDTYFLISQSWTVDTLVEELYDVIDRATTLVDTDRRDSAAAALRDANPSLPPDETPFDATDLTFVWVPLLPRSPLRLLDDPTGIRADLAARGLRNVHDLVRQRETWLVTDMATDGWTSAQVLRARALARLMNVRGVSRDLALELHDGSTTDVIRTPTQLRDMDQLALKLRIVATSPPTEVLALRPWFRLKRQVATQIRRRRKVEPMQRPVPYGANVARGEQEFWATAAREPARTVVERTSARTCADLFELQGLMISAFDNQRGGRPSTTQRAHHRLLRKLATHAQAEGLIGGTSPQRNGISLANLLRLVGRWMPRIERDDVDLARRRLRQPSQDPGQGVLGITLSDLTSTARSAVVGDLSAVRLRQAGRGAVDVALREMSETTLSGLPTAARTDMTSTTSAARTVDLPDIDRVHLRKNLAAMTFGTLQTDLPDAFAALGDALPLADLADAVSTPLGSAWDVGSNALKSRLGETLLDSMTPFERYVCIRPSFRPSLPLCVPLSSQLVPRYLADVLRALDALGDGRVYWYTAEDFADPIRFAFVLLLARSSATA